MSRGEAFCVACGAGPPHSSDRLCETCFRDRNSLSECDETSQAYRCPKCGMNFESSRWGFLETDDLLQRRLDDALRIHERAEAVGIATQSEIIDERNVRIHVQVDGQIDAFYFDEKHEVIVRTSNMICKTCTRKDGNYYEATLQIRSAVENWRKRNSRNYEVHWIHCWPLWNLIRCSSSPRKDQL